MLLFNKTVDRSLLKEGFTIPINYQKGLLTEIGMDIPRGTKKRIRIVLGENVFEATIINIAFDANRYPHHGDLLQIRYPANGALAQALQSIFSCTVRRIEAMREMGESTRVASWDNAQKEYVAVYSSAAHDTVFFECITNRELLEEAHEITKYDEIIAEEILEAEDPTASVEIQSKLCKVRKMNRAIGSELKQLYGYRCQICGQFIGQKYGSRIIHAHHIEYFTKSLNNDASNILIVCPNHHGIIHDRNPEFDNKTKTFHYPNGYVEGLLLNLHI